MSLWGNIDRSNNAPKFAVVGGYGVSANGNTLFGNTTVGAYISNTSVGVFGVDTTEAGISNKTADSIQHAGWNVIKKGTGPVISISVTDPGANYRSNGFITFSGGEGTGANARYNINTTSNTITTVTLLSPGSNYTSSPTANAANSTSVNSATFSVSVGGRAGRVTSETLVACGSISEDASDDTTLPDS